MSAILDTNLYINFLLSKHPARSAVGVILAAALTEAFVLLFAREIAEEITATIAKRPDLAASIRPETAAALIDRIERFAEVVPPLPADPPEVGRDRKDDYLIAHAVAAGADYLVSRDKDLLDLVVVSGVRVVDPPTFLAVLRSSGRLAM